MNNNYLLNQSLMFSGIYRAYVIKRNDYRVYIPGLMNDNVLNDDESLNETKYNQIKETLPTVLFNSNALKNLLDDKPTSCWVMFENGDSKSPIVMGYLGKGVKSVPSKTDEENEEDEEIIKIEDTNNDSIDNSDSDSDTNSNTEGSV